MAAAAGASAVGERRGLMVNNSLAKENVPFVTKDGSRNGEWEVVIWGGVRLDRWCIEELARGGG